MLTGIHAAIARLAGTIPCRSTASPSSLYLYVEGKINATTSAHGRVVRIYLCLIQGHLQPRITRLSQTVWENTIKEPQYIMAGTCTFCSCCCNLQCARVSRSYKLLLDTNTPAFLCSCLAPSSLRHPHQENDSLAVPRQPRLNTFHLDTYGHIVKTTRYLTNCGKQPLPCCLPAATHMSGYWSRSLVGHIWGTTTTTLSTCVNQDC